MEMSVINYLLSFRPIHFSIENVLSDDDRWGYLQLDSPDYNKIILVKKFLDRPRHLIIYFDIDNLIR